MEKLEFAEDRLKDAMTPFLTSIFRKFYEKRQIWERCVSVLTELDCLASFAILSGQADTEMVRPIILKRQDNQCGTLNIKQMVHPCVKMSGKSNFIPNDTLINND